MLAGAGAQSSNEPSHKAFSFLPGFQQYTGAGRSGQSGKGKPVVRLALGPGVSVQAILVRILLMDLLDFRDTEGRFRRFPLTGLKSSFSQRLRNEFFFFFSSWVVWNETSVVDLCGARVEPRQVSWRTGAQKQKI